MSASSKPPRGTHNAKPPTVDRVARVLLDAEALGDKAAARRHGVHFKTVSNWRRDWGDAPSVVAEMGRLRAEVRAGWIDEARDARRRLIDRVTELAAKSKSLRAVTDALRRTNEMVMAHEIVHDGDDQPHGPDQPARARPPEGEGGAEGGGEEAED